VLVGGHSSGGVQYAQRVDGCQREQFVAPCEVAWWVMKWQLAVELYRVGEAEEEDGAVGSD